MTVRTKPTPAQLLVLSAAAAGALRRSEAGHDLYRPFATGSYSGAVIQRRTVERCIRNGWLALGERDRASVSRPIMLTDAGNDVLGTNRV